MFGPMGPSAIELRTIPLFHGFADEELIPLGGLFEKIDGGLGKILFDVGEPAIDLYVLTDGEVVLDSPADDVFRLHPPALIGELGALTGLSRSTRATLTPGSTVWALRASMLQDYLASRQELGLRFLVNLLGLVADKVHRDQRRLGDMRQNLIRTQKELKRLREVVLEAAETPLSAPVHDALEKMITHNRRVNYRVEPPPALAATIRLADEAVPVSDISRTHVSVASPTPPAVGTWLSGVLHLAGAEILISGRVARVYDNKLTLELDLLIDEYAAILEGYLTRAQLLDILC
jgi:CRP-like cAMP-binding protein